uniref:Transmembrane protein 8B n=1 Tax=Oryctolagus cuniculus TaxID=9986 RepID=A0A5F9DRV3_RABIT
MAQPLSRPLVLSQSWPWPPAPPSTRVPNRSQPWSGSLRMPRSGFQPRPPLQPQCLPLAFSSSLPRPLFHPLAQSPAQLLSRPGGQCLLKPLAQPQPSLPPLSQPPLPSHSLPLFKPRYAAQPNPLCQPLPASLCLPKSFPPGPPLSHTLPLSQPRLRSGPQLPPALLLLLLFSVLGPGAGGLFLTDYSTCSPRKLSPFRSFASTELFHFHIPEDTFLAVWNLIIFKEQGGTFGDHCPDQSVTVYFRSGAPPVINPLHTHFPGDTAVPGVFSLTLSWTLPNRTSGIFNVSSPLPGDWFLAAHLPQAHGHISVKSSLRQENVTVFGCLTHEVPLSLGDAAVTCSKESLAGFLLSVSATSRVARLRIPFPQTGTWFLTLRSLCGAGPRFVRCRNATAEVRLRTFLSPCVDDCGPYGQCKLLRTHNYLYAACECKAGWRGWGCTDSADALTYGFQLLSTLLLCLSNLMFLPPVVLAIRSRYVLEASVYTFTMFFSTFYHACDQPGIVVFCIMDYDVLQFCDFLGSLMSVWVTVIAMARLQPVVKQVLYLLGAMLLSMALQLDRHGLWNLLGPSLFALGILATAWTVRSVRRRHCYPPTWRRWLFYLCPGSLIAGSAILLYAFVETRDNYFYIHSIWHMLIAGSVGFLLPPRAKADPRVPSGARARGCGYQLCINEQEELGLVGPGGATVSSICAS